MLRAPKRLPRRFNRTVSPRTRQLVQRRLQRKRDWQMRKFKRVVQKTQQRIEWIKRSAWRLLPVGLVVLVLVIGYVLLFSSLFSVRSITIIHSDVRLDTALIQRSLKPLFKRHMLFVSALEVPALLSADLAKINRSAVPDLQEVILHKRYPSQLQVEITVKPIAYRLEIAEPGLPTAAPSAQAGSGSDFLTSDGLYVVYDAAKVRSGATLPLLHIVDWGVRPAPWQPLVSTDMLTALERAETSVRADLAIPIRGRTVFVRAREFHLQTDKVALWFDLKSTIADQLAHLKIYRQIAAGTAREYVDLRLKDKVVYR